MEKLTVIISGYNCEKSIKRCIYSILNQTYKNIQIIVIDDASKDKTYEICKEIEKKENRLEIYRNNKNLGVSQSRNIGIKHAIGEFITFVDSDDYIEYNMYEKLIKKIKCKNLDIAMCNFFMEYGRKDIRPNLNAQYVLKKEELINKIFLTKYFCGFVWNKIYKTEILRDNKIFFEENIHICEDLLFNCRYFLFVKEGFYTEEKLYHYIQNINSTYNSKKYNSNWCTVIDSYEMIKKIINVENIKNFKYSYLLAILDLKEKVYLNNIKDNRLIKKINKIILENKKGIFFNEDLNILTKIKVYAKIYVLRLFLDLKKIRNLYNKN